MIVYRITLARWASKLSASGYPARWNPKNVNIIYTAESIALACLENLVHRSGEGLNANFKLIEIEIPDDVSSKMVKSYELPVNWHLVNGYIACQRIGREWVEQQETCIIYVPSSIIREENNILINPQHPEFNQIKIRNISEFSFDERL